MFNLLTESCPYQNWTSVARERCPNPVNFHCLKDEFGRIGWVCTDPIWVEKDRCPGFNIGAKKLDTTPCFQTKCPLYNYRSNDINIGYVCRYIMKRESTSSVSSTTMFPASTGTNKTITLIPVFITIPVLVILVVVVALICRRNLRKRKLEGVELGESGNLIQKPIESSDKIKKQTRSFKTAKNILSIKETIVITGVQGSGKTFLAKSLVSDLESNGNILRSTWISNISQLSEETEKHRSKEDIFIFDDVFYELQTDQKFTKTFQAINEFMAGTEKPYVIVTIPSYIWKNHSKELKAYFDWVHINLDKRDNSEKRVILQSLLSRYDIPGEQADTICKLENDLLKFTSNSIGFPAIVSWICKQSNEESVQKLLTAPLKSISGKIDSLKISPKVEESGKYLILAYMSLKDGKMDVDNLDQDLFDKIKNKYAPKFRDKDLEKYARTMVGNYLLKNVVDGSYEFDLNIMKKIVFASLAKEDLLFVQEISKNDYLKYIITTELCPDDMDDNYTECFALVR